MSLAYITTIRRYVAETHQYWLLLKCRNLATETLLLFLLS